MTTATATRSWQREPVGDPAPPTGHRPRRHCSRCSTGSSTSTAFKSLSVNDLWHDRPVRGGQRAVVASGGGVRRRYEDPGQGRQYMLTNVLPDLIVYSFELERATDPRLRRLPASGRRPARATRNGGWARQNPGSHSRDDGRPWAQWLHVEAGEWAWNDDRPVPDKLGPTKEVRDMAAPASVIDAKGDGWVFWQGKDGALWMQYAGNKAQSLGGQVTDRISAADGGRRDQRPRLRPRRRPLPVAVPRHPDHRRKSPRPMIADIASGNVDLADVLLLDRRRSCSSSTPSFGAGPRRAGHTARCSAGSASPPRHRLARPLRAVDASASSSCVIIAVIVLLIILL